jgi:regulator of cell morphogenesis and NO signaling
MRIDFSGDTAVKDIVVHHPETRTVLERLGVDYCCSGKIPLAQAAQEAGLSAEQVLADLDQAVNAPQSNASAKDWTLTSLGELADHIERTHHAFMKAQLPRLVGLLDKTLQAHRHRYGEMLKQLKNALISLKTDIEMHLVKEEKILFPLIRQVDAYRQGQGPVPDVHCGTVAHPIQQMEYEHEQAGRFLDRIRTITSDFQLPDDACETFRALYDGLRDLESDLHEHIHLENNILFPKAVEIEARTRQ